MIRKKTADKSEKIARIIYLSVLFSFIIPIVFLILRIIMSDSVPAESADVRSKADYLLMLLECVLGVVVIHLPSFLQKRFKFELPTALYLMYILFLYCAIFLGEVRDFYYLVPHWDTILHTFSSVMAGAFGFIVVATLSRDEHTAISLPPLFVALFAFCFASTIGTLWEIYEFSFDAILGLNMQKFRLADGTLLIGHAALGDTMKDIIVDVLGALGASIAGFFSLRNNRGWASDMITQYCNKPVKAKG
ncbi:MAG: hypothetical protein RRZ24_09025 [Clostridia bacterium]